MRIIILLLLTFLLTQPALSQPPSKAQTQAKMLEAKNNISNKIADLEKQIATAKKENPEKVKSLEEKRAMLKQQLTMMEGLSKNVSNVSEKTIQLAAEEESLLVPKKDLTRINALPKKILSNDELVSFVRNVHTEVEKKIPAAEKAEALKIYNETKAEYKSPNTTGNAASGCWIYGHKEKAVYIMGKACLDDLTDPDNLNNYAAFLIMAGGEQWALPILENLNKKYSENSTILNNIGQAWFGLGEITNAKKYLESATQLYANHSQANLTLSEIYKSEGDSAKAILALKRSLKESFSTEKESEITRLGGTVEKDDITWDIPWETDPYGSEPLLNIKPAFAGSLSEIPKARAFWRGVDNALKKEKERLAKIQEEQQKKAEEFQQKWKNDKPFQQKKIKSKSAKWKKANRKALEVYTEKEGSVNAASLEKRKKDDEYNLQLLELRNELISRIAVITNEYFACMELCKNSNNSGCESACETVSCDKTKSEEAGFLGRVSGILTERHLWERNFYKKYKEAMTNYAKYAQLDGSIWDLEVTTTEINLLSAIEQIHQNVINGYGNLSLCGLKNYDEDDLASFTLTEPKKPSKCDFYKRINAIVVNIELICNEIKFDELKLKYKGENSPLGTAQMGQNKPGSKRNGPLKDEAYDPSNSSVELNPSGIGDMKIPLNNNNTQIADPAAKETGVTDRFSWKAADARMRKGGGGGNRFLLKR